MLRTIGRAASSPAATVAKTPAAAPEETIAATTASRPTVAQPTIVAGRRGKGRIAPGSPSRLRGVGLIPSRSEEHTSELQSRFDLVCRLLLEKTKRTQTKPA